MTDKELKQIAEHSAALLLRLSEEAYSLLDGRERDAIALVRFVCHEIADGDR